MITIEDLDVDLGDFQLTNINLTVQENQFFVLMGPTGAGKTVLLEAIGGLVSVKKGKIYIDGKDITMLPPEKRGISIVYQDCALFPHMTVLGNISYGLHFHKVEKPERNRRIQKYTSELNLFHLLNRNPDTLSGGELQRVALARALMVKPRVLLLDEPLSSLDPAFREEIRDNLKQLHQNSETTFIMVTHDFAEALTLAQNAAVINNGSIEQEGSIEEIFQKPGSHFVADFVGMKNIFSVVYKNNTAVTGNISIETGTKNYRDTGYIAIRPEDVVLSRNPPHSSMRNIFQGTVREVRDKGFFYEVLVKAGSVIFTSLITKRSLVELRIYEGEKIYILFKAASIHHF
ncbi:MAG: ATP-binding cassette domain-containing protein [Spirochaetota bacterium]